MDGQLLDALALIFTPLPFFFTALGVFLGIVVGAVPGLNGAMLIALSLPLTYYMPTTQAVVLLVSMYTGAIAGGLITATLLRMPGTPSNIMTTFDGHPLARAGRPGRALGLGIGSSLIGGLVAWVALLLLAKPLSIWATRFGPFEIFALIMMAMVLIASVSHGSLVKGLLSGLLGALATMPGVDPSAGQPRLTWDWYQLNSGLKLLPVLIGVFAVSQILKELVDLGRPVERMGGTREGLWMTLGDYRRHWFNLLRSSVLGTWVGLLPGVGASVGSVVAYTVAKNTSRQPEEFGKGSEEGIVASEAANNATIGGALIPLIAMGIPGSVIDAILIGALMLHSVQPGPTLFLTNPDIVWAMIAACLVSTILMYLIMTASVGLVVKITTIPRTFMLPVISVFCVIGAFGTDNSIFDVWVMLAFGGLGFLLERINVPLGPFVIGFVLAPLAEAKLRTGLMMTGGSFWPFLESPVAAAFFLIAIALLVWSLHSEWQLHRSAQRRA